MNPKNLAKFVGIFVLLMVTVAIAAEAVQNTKASISWRYKMTVTIETPEGFKTGSAVREVTITQQKIKAPNITAGGRIEGEAVVVDLGKRGVLFALIADQDYLFLTKGMEEPVVVTSSGLKVGTPGPLTPEGAEYYKNLKNAKVTLNPNIYPGYPRLVTFGDLNDPKTVQLVMKWKQGPTPPYPIRYTLEENNFGKIFGEGVNLKEIIVERTEEPVTWLPVEKYLPWIHQYRSKLFDGEKIHTIKSAYPQANSLGAGDFTTRRNENE